MVNRLKKDNILEMRSDKAIYKDKLILIHKYKCDFRNFTNYVQYFEVVLSMLPGTNFPTEIKDYFHKMLSIPINLKSLAISDFDTLDLSEYQETMKAFVRFFDYLAPIEKPLISGITPIEQDYEEFESRVNGVWVKNIPINVENKETLMFDKKEEGSYYKYILPQEATSKYDEHLIFTIENVTGHFHTDTFLALLSPFGQLNLDRNTIPVNGKFGIISKLKVHIEIVHVVNLVIQQCVYLRNSESFRNGKMYGFDSAAIEQNLQLARSIAKNSVNVF